jgi:hypothetical protein
MSARRATAVLLTIALASVFIACGQTNESPQGHNSPTALAAAANGSDTPTPDVTPSSVPATAPPPTEAPAPVQTAPPSTAPPATEPPTAPPQAEVQFTSVVGGPPGAYASAAVQTTPGASCSISYVTPAGTNSSAAGLVPSAADSTGAASWSWKIGSNTHPGTGSVRVTCNGASATASIQIG